MHRPFLDRRALLHNQDDGSANILSDDYPKMREVPGCVIPRLVGNEKVFHLVSMRKINCLNIVPKLVHSLDQLLDIAPAVNHRFAIMESCIIRQEVVFRGVDRPSSWLEAFHLTFQKINTALQIPQMFKGTAGPGE